VKRAGFLITWQQKSDDDGGDPSALGRLETHPGGGVASLRP